MTSQIFDDTLVFAIGKNILGVYSVCEDTHVSFREYRVATLREGIDRYCAKEDITANVLTLSACGSSVITA
ncbi:MAG: hypothetical protein ACR2RB_07300 [Gammaproteobacteria bacterium]